MPDADGSASGRILVVDDDPTVSDVVARYLRREGYDVTLAADGLVALEVAAQIMPDLVVLDIMLPGLDGLAVCRMLRERSPVEMSPRIADVPRHGLGQLREPPVGGRQIAGGGVLFRVGESPGDDTGGAVGFRPEGAEEIAVGDLHLSVVSCQ